MHLTLSTNHCMLRAEMFRCEWIACEGTVHMRCALLTRMRYLLVACGIDALRTHLFVRSLGKKGGAAFAACSREPKAVKRWTALRGRRTDKSWP